MGAFNDIVSFNLYAIWDRLRDHGASSLNAVMSDESKGLTAAGTLSLDRSIVLENGSRICPPDGSEVTWSVLSMLSGNVKEYLIKGDLPETLSSREFLERAFLLMHDRPATASELGNYERILEGGERTRYDILRDIASPGDEASQKRSPLIIAPKTTIDFL